MFGLYKIINKLKCNKRLKRYHVFSYCFKDFCALNYNAIKITHSIISCVPE